MKRIVNLACALLLTATVGVPSVAFLQSAPPQSAPPVSESPKQEAVELVLGKPVERELKGGETHTYILNLKAGEYMEIQVEQKGIDTTVIVSDPNEKGFVEVKGLEGIFSKKPVFLVAMVNGTYKLEIISNNVVKPGRYSVVITEHRIACKENADLLIAQRAYSDGINLFFLSGTKADREAAINKFETALICWRSYGIQINEARTLYALSYIFQSTGQIQKALEFCQKGLLICRAINYQIGKANLLNRLGLILDNLGETKKSLDCYDEAISIFHSSGDYEQESIALSNTGLAYSRLSEKRKAIIYYLKALEIQQVNINLQQHEAITLNNIGMSYKDLGENQKALDYFFQASSLRHKLNDYQSEAITLINIGAINRNLGEHKKAIDYYTQALTHFQNINDQRGKAIALNNIGTIYKDLKQNQKALDCLNKSLLLFRSMNDRQGEAFALINIGATYINLNEKQKSLENYSQALQLFRTIGERKGEGQTLSYIGSLYKDLGDYEKAIGAFMDAVQLQRLVESRYEETFTHFNWSKLVRDKGDLLTARMKIEEAVKLVEFVRSNVSDPSLKASYFATVRSYYDLYIDILMRMHKADPRAGHDLEAFQVSERARARSLLELLAESRADIRQGVDPRLLEQERSLQDRLKGKQERLTRLLVGKHTPEQADEAKKEIDALTDEYRQVQTKIRQTSPRYAALTQPEPLTVKQLQQDVLDSDTVLLEYALGEDKSYLWAVTKDAISGVELPKRADIEPTACKLYDLLKSKAASGEWRNLSKTDKTTRQGEYLTTATALSKLLLGPVADKLAGKRLVVVADGALQYIPFAALPEPESIDKKKPEPLVVRHEIVSLPSASALAVLRNETKDRKPAEKTLAVLADPVFSTDDQRIASAKSVEPSAQTAANLTRERVLSRMVGTSDDEVPDADRAAKEQRLVIPRLPYTRDEAEQIGRFAESDRLFKALDFQASRETATGDELSRYRYVHFATHGLLDAERPELSSIVLSLVDKEGKVQDGFLRAFDVYNLNLPAEVVTLSACKTGLGKDIKGEGLVGLTRGFMYAGARRVVVSLWAVNDKATAELMTRFYRKMLKEGQRPAAALRMAQVEMWRDKQWNAPFYWAGFTLQGEWR